MSSDTRTHFLLSGYELAVSIFVGLGVFLFINASVMLDRFREKNREGVEILEQEVSQNFDTVLDNISAVPITATVVTLLLWMFVGVVVYFLTNYFIKLAQDFGDDVKVSAFYMHPKHFRQSRFWLYVVLQAVYALFSGTLLIVWTLASFMVFLPFSKTTFLLGIAQSTPLLSTIIMVFVALLTTLLVTFGYALLIKLFRSRIS